MNIQTLNTASLDYTQDTTPGPTGQTGAAKNSAKPEATAGMNPKTSELPFDTVSLNDGTSVSTESHEAKLTRIQESVKSGTYSVSASLLADKLIKAGVITLQNPS